MAPRLNPPSKKKPTESKAISEKEANAALKLATTNPEKAKAKAAAERLFEKKAEPEKTDSAESTKQTRRRGAIKNEKPAPLAEIATRGDAFEAAPDKSKVKELVAELNAIDNKSAEAGGLKSAVMKRAEEKEGLHRGALAKAARYYRMDPSKRDPELKALGAYLFALGITPDPTLFDALPPDTIPPPKAETVKEAMQ